MEIKGFKGLKRMDFKGFQEILRDFKRYPGFSRNFMISLGIFRCFDEYSVVLMDLKGF